MTSTNYKCESTFDEYATLCIPLDGIRRTLRDLRPAHYLFKVVSYSLLEDDCNYESDVFQVGDYKWKLCLYPNGDTKRNGSGFVSLYLTISDTNTLPCGFEVNVNFRLFVYDQIQDKYLTVQDIGEGATRRFHENKTQWGFSQLVHLDIFKDASNGYLIDDCCVFGAELFYIIECTDFKSYCLRPKAKEPRVDTYTWKMEKISTLKNELYKSEVFVLFGREWQLVVYLNGIGSSKGKDMSLFLTTRDVPKEHSVLAEFDLCIRDQLHNNHLKRTDKHLFKSQAGRGFPNFIPIEQLRDPSRGFLKDDALIIEVQLSKHSMVKNG